MTKNGNRIIMKITLGILIAGFAITVAAIVWDASHKSASIEINRKHIDVIIPKVEADKEACQEFKYKNDRLDEKMIEQSSIQKQILSVQQQILTEVKK